MTNYENYPKHRLCKNSCIICFNNGGYSWCMLSNSQKKYLYNSGYIDDARNIVVMFYSGKQFSFDKDSFRKWLKEEIDKTNGDSK